MLLSAIKKTYFSIKIIKKSLLPPLHACKASDLDSYSHRSTPEFRPWTDTKNEEMTRLWTIYGRFVRTVLEGGDLRDYHSICRSLHVHPDDLNEILESELGYTGDELLQKLRSGKFCVQ